MPDAVFRLSAGDLLGGLHHPAIESLNYSLRKIIQGQGTFPHYDAIQKLWYLGLKNASKKWMMPVRDWKAALNQFIILFGDRVPV